MRKLYAVPAAAALLCLSLAMPCRAQGSRPAKKKAAPKAAPQEAPAAGGADKTALEAYLRDRSERIRQMHKQRAEFIVEETNAWNGFWTKVKDDRLLFEVRITRQRLDLFDSLASLESHSHAPSLVNFEKLQADVIKAFEQQQKDKMTSFFTERDARSRAFAAQQEKDRLESVADAEEAWRDQKASASMRGADADSHASEREDRPERRERKSSKKEKAKPIEEEEPAEEEQEEAPRSRSRSSRKGDEGSAVRFGPP